VDKGVVLISGCSSGFGLVSAVALARDGWQVFATMRDPDRRAALDTAAETAGVGVEVLQLDVCDPASIDRAVAEVLSRAGRLDAVVHNAGIADAGFFEDLPDEQFRRVIETNFFGTLALTRAVLPIMREQRRGRIVVVSSTSAFVAEPGLSAYASSKWAVEGWAQSLAVEVAPFGIDVALIEPGKYKTDIWDKAAIAGPAGSPYRAFVDAMEPKIRAMVERNGRDPAEVARRIVRVLSARRPRFRNPVGPDARITWAMSHLLPFSIRRRILARATGIHAVAAAGGHREDLRDGLRED
jgi:NAD(P)-dependent dehydrogenase (short-subunit alcohol dehydrogenase family)